MGCRLQYVSVHQLKYLNYVVRLNVLLSSRFWSLHLRNYRATSKGELCTEKTLWQSKNRKI